jgi:hypothetical protein
MGILIGLFCSFKQIVKCMLLFCIVCMYALRKKQKFFRNNSCFAFYYLNLGIFDDFVF